MNCLCTYGLCLLALLCTGTFLNAQSTSPWYTSTTVYQIYPLSFQDSDADGIGDINGIIARLDYLQQLGVETLWISPVYPSPWEDHGYDISNYKNIHPRLGTLADMDRLIAEAKKRNLRVLMDLVMNHTSHRHPWFEASRRDTANGTYRNLYVWKEGKHRPNNWKSMTGGHGWQYDTLARAWYWASFLPFQPDLNYYNPAVKDSMFSIMEFWLHRGVDGFRLDIFNCLAEDSAFRNNPGSLRAIPSEDNPNGYFQKVTYTQNTPATFAFARDFRKRLDSLSHKQAFSVGEVFGKPEILRAYTENNQGLHSVFLFKTLHAGFKAKRWQHILQENEEQFTAPLLPTWVLSNHDKKRFISRIGNNDRKMRCMAFIQFTQRGIPFLYQGEEFGMRQQRLNPKQAQDPIVKKYGAFATRLARFSGESLNRDECRTPMAWDTSKNAGFSNADSTWLPMGKEAGTINAQTALADSFSLYHTYRELIALRKNMPVLTEGNTHSIALKNKVLSYARTLGTETVRCYVNFSKRPKKLPLKPIPGQHVYGNAGIDNANRFYLRGQSFVMVW